MPSWRTLGGLPNLLSSSRFVLAAGFVVADSTGARVGLIGAAAATDFLDGWVARRSDRTSRWGALLDPIADRVFVLTAVGALLLGGLLSTTEYFVLIIRDLATAVGFVVARLIPWLRPVVFQARPAGKVVTVLQLVALATALAAPELLPALLPVVAIVSLASVVDYTVALWRARTR
ncbi:MAG: CDP-alcohol phosphatidyltransferase [Gemmatimonadetes bacterium]|jgi:cardiolipin synthase|nr:CDP-alcohol phosphatidyltransferase [Gemmatimonadota bacterium]